jgi:hypothetical protein
MSLLAFSVAPGVSFKKSSAYITFFEALPTLEALAAFVKVTFGNATTFGGGKIGSS